MRQKFASLGVDSGQMAVLVGSTAASGLSNHIVTRAKAGREYKVLLVREDHNKNSNKNDAIFVWTGDDPPMDPEEVECYDGGTLVFDKDTDLVICDPCYVLRGDKRKEYKKLVDNIGRNCTILTSDTGELLGVSCHTLYGDGEYPGAVQEDDDGYATLIYVEFG